MNVLDKRPRGREREAERERERERASEGESKRTCKRKGAHAREKAHVQERLQGERPRESRQTETQIER